MEDIEESLRKAAEIRRTLKGRQHSDSTTLVAEDRNRTASDSDPNQELTLEDLLAHVTTGNEHDKVDWDPPIGKEEW